MPRSQPSATAILIVEDNELDSLLLQEALKKASPSKLELMAAVTVGEAIKLLRENRFDVILSDLSLPDGLGLDTFTQLHTHVPETPIILLSGFESEAIGQEAIRMGAREFVVKGSMNEKALWRVIAYAIECHALEKAAHDSEARYQRLLHSVTGYTYAVTVEHGHSVSTVHGPGCVAITGYTSDDFACDPDLWHRMVHEEDRCAVLEQAERVLAGEAVVLEHRIIDKNGAVRWVRHTPLLHLDAKNRVTGYDGLILDITELKQAGEALKAAEAQLADAKK